MTNIGIKLLNDSAIVPTKGSEYATGYDLYATEKVTLMSGAFYGVSTGISTDIPHTHEAQIRPRSGLAFNNGITVLNSPGSIDSDFIGEIKVILVNHGPHPFTIEKGMRIAQIVFAEKAETKLVIVSELTTSERGEGGFGSTGLK